MQEACCLGKLVRFFSIRVCHVSFTSKPVRPAPAPCMDDKYCSTIVPQAESKEEETSPRYKHQEDKLAHTV